MRKSHLVLISVLITLLCSISHAGVGKTSLVRDFSLTSQRIQTHLYIIHDRLNNDRQFAGAVEQLQSLVTDFRVACLLLGERLRQQALLAEPAGGPAVNRQARMTGRYELLLGELLPLLEQLSNPASFDSEELERAIELLDQLLSKRQSQLHGQLPYLSPEPVTIPLQLEPVVVPAYRQMAAVVSADDLMSSPEAPASALISHQAQEIAAQAQKLNWDPVDLYEWVKNNITTEWYRGCMKGAEETLRQRSGNDADQSALLIALLRASGYPARYVQGVIEFFPGIESLQSLTGIREPDHIGDFFARRASPANRSWTEAGS